MKKYLRIFFILLVFLSFYYLGRLIATKQSKSSEIFPDYKVQRKWTLVTESPRYRIFNSWEAGVVAVLDKNFDLILTPNSSCEINIPDGIKNKSGNNFYNNTVGIINVSPYKSIVYNKVDDVFVQTVINAGCVSEEGRIKINTAPDNQTIDCTIEIGYKDLGC